MTCFSVLESIQINQREAGPPPLAGLHTLVDSIGAGIIWPNLIDFLQSTSGGTHCVVWELRHEQMNQVGAASWNGADQARRRLVQYATPKFWRRDPALDAIRRHSTEGSTVLVRMDPRAASDALIRKTLYGEDHICERVVMCRLEQDFTFGLSVVRSEEQGPFSTENIITLTALASPILAILLKHKKIVNEEYYCNPIFGSNIGDVERCLRSTMPSLPQRERQVCARLIIGKRMSNIAKELGVGTETIETYRKRAYARMNISSRHELVLIYSRFR